jgi:hypothetical protein
MTLLHLIRFPAAVLAFSVCSAPLASAADLDAPPPVVSQTASAWTFSLATYSWLPWISGDINVRNREIDVDAAPDDILRSLDWSTLPVWMSYAELRNGPLTIFNDIVWTALEDGQGFDRRFISGEVQVDYSQLTVELGAAYAVWSQGGATVDVLAGGRYWRQNTDVFVAGSGGRLSLDASATVDWVDPFIGARLIQPIAPGQSVLVRGDVGGFGAGSDFSWQALATYNMKLCETGGTVIDGYFGYRALAVDYSEGAYELDVVQHGPVMGLTMNF